MTHDQLVTRARSGDRLALDELLREMKDMVYNLALRMLGTPADAEDAAQEILIRLVTGLGSFRGDSSFRTWVYRVASNQLLTTRKRLAEQQTASFDELGELLDGGVATDAVPLDEARLVLEAKMICTSKMLLCLDRDHRIAYILGEILELASDEAAAALDIAPEAFRKRLSRARIRMEGFTSERCGIVDRERPCRCAKQAANAIAHQMIDPARLTWSSQRALAERTANVAELDRIMQTVELMRSTPQFAAPDSIVDGLRALLDDPRSPLLA